MARKLYTCCVVILVLRPWPQKSNWCDFTSKRSYINSMIIFMCQLFCNPVHRAQWDTSVAGDVPTVCTHHLRSPHLQKGSAFSCHPHGASNWPPHGKTLQPAQGRVEANNAILLPERHLLRHEDTTSSSSSPLTKVPHWMGDIPICPPLSSSALRSSFRNYM